MAFVECCESLAHLFCSSELLLLATNQAGIFFSRNHKKASSRFVLLTQIKTHLCAEEEFLWPTWGTAHEARSLTFSLHRKRFQGKRRKTTGSSWPGESGTWLPLKKKKKKNAAWHLTLVFLPLIKQTRYNMLMSKLLEVQAGGLFNLSWVWGERVGFFLSPYCLLQI